MCCLCSLKSDNPRRSCSTPAASPAQTRRHRLRPTSSSAEHEFGFVVPLRHAHPLHSFAPLDFFSRTQVRVRGWLLIPQEPSAVRSPFISGPLLSFILALTSFAHLATFCQLPESSLSSIVAMCCCRHVDAPFRTTRTTNRCSSPAVSCPRWP